MLSGLNSFIKMYKKLQSMISPTPSIAHALHQFGKVDSVIVVSQVPRYNNVCSFRKYEEEREVWEVHQSKFNWDQTP